MDSLRGRYRAPSEDVHVSVGTSSAVLTQAFVARSLQRKPRRDDGLDGFRGAVNAVLFSLAIWAAIGVVLFLLP